MKIAIHTNKRSFAARWEKYCKENGIEYKLVNAYDNDIVDKVKDCDAFMWHFHHADYRDMQFAKSLLTSLQKSGKKVSLLRSLRSLYQAANSNNRGSFVF